MTSCRLYLLLAVLAVAASVGLTRRTLVAQSQQADEARRVLLLRTGRVLEGKIREIATGWVVSQSNGHVVIPADQVQFEAASLEDMYLRLRLEMREPTPGMHLKLADWCLSQKLYLEAMRELRDALKLDPSNETARVMLDRIEQDVRRKTQSLENVAVEPASSVGVLRIGARRSGSEIPEARSLAGLSRESAEDFVARIQPLLSSKCGNARCHGAASSNAFQLERVAGRSRLRVERNLAAALRFVDPDMPAGSRLLMPIDRAHGRRMVFSDSAGAKQADVLREWVLAVAAELRQSGRSRLKSQLAVADGEPRLISPGRGSGESRDGSQFKRADERFDEFSSPTGAREIGDRDVPLDGAGTRQTLTRFQKLLIEVEDAAEEVDVFDPGEFNRRYAADQSSPATR